MKDDKKQVPLQVSVSDQIEGLFRLTLGWLGIFIFALLVALVIQFLLGNL